MNRTILILIIVGAVAGGLWWKNRTHPTGPAEAPKPPEEEKIKITHDTNGNVVVHIPDEIQGNAGVTVSKPAGAEFSPELKGYGRVVDIAPLSAAFAELLAARMTAEYSRQELERMKVLKAQNNASERAYQTAEAAYARDQTVVNLSLVKIRPVWGDKIAEKLSVLVKPEAKDAQPDPLFANLAEGRTALIRIDLPAGQTIDPAEIKSARLAPIVDQNASIEAEFFSLAPTVDPQTQGRGLFFLASDNKGRLTPGTALTAFLRFSGAAVAGVIVPPEAVVRAEGAAWVYVMGDGSDTFTRTPISLDHPTEKGWFIANGPSTNNYLVTTGAQTILSQETKPAGGPD